MKLFILLSLLTVSSAFAAEGKVFVIDVFSNTASIQLDGEAAQKLWDSMSMVEAKKIDPRSTFATKKGESIECMQVDNQPELTRCSVYVSNLVQGTIR